MAKYKTIVFDLGNVLLPFDYAPFIKKLEDIKPGLGNKVIATYKENYHIHRTFESGLLNETEFLEIMMNWTDGAISEEIFCQIFSAIFTENRELTSYLPILKKNYQLVLLSNTNSIHKRYGWEKYEFLKYFDKLCLSHEIGAVKPDIKIYKAVESFTRHLPQEHIFIDDIQEYADGAKKAGWDAIRFTDNITLLSEFKLRGIL
jgi:glucose-1-phosphatase